MTHPIGPTAHGALDYTFAALCAAGPAALDLDGPARATSYAFSGLVTAMSAFTNYPPSIKRAIPLRVHGALETPFLPAILAVPWMVGAMRERKARYFFGGLFAIAVTTYMLSDYNADAPDAPPPFWQRVFER